MQFKPFPCFLSRVSGFHGIAFLGSGTSSAARPAKRHVQDRVPDLNRPSPNTTQECMHPAQANVPNRFLRHAACLQGSNRQGAFLRAPESRSGDTTPPRWTCSVGENVSASQEAVEPDFRQHALPSPQGSMLGDRIPLPASLHAFRGSPSARSLPGGGARGENCHKRRKMRRRHR